MNAYINYLIEANLGLALVLLAYVLLLRKETDFSMKRIFLLIGIIASLLFPFIHLQGGSTQSIPSISSIVSSYWLPEVTITGEYTGKSSVNITLGDIATGLQWFYIIILVFLLVRFFAQLVSLVRTITTSKGYVWNHFQIVESPENQTTFSFFNFIFIGHADSLSAEDKNKIIQHEVVHARKLHSIDIVLLNVLGIFFWFNPLIKRYKKIFVQLHEFEADARAVENTEVNEYCNLLAKVALQSADYPLANHFNQSLTLKRIEMMRTLKHKIKKWKIMTLVSFVLLLFFVIACQDQMADINEIAKNSTNALVVPENVQARYDQLKAENPNSNYILVELNKEAQTKLVEMEKQYGLPKSMEVFKFPIGKFYDQTKMIAISGESNGVIITGLDQEKESEEYQTFAILEYNDMTAKISEGSKQEGEVYSVVDEPPMPKGGLEKYYEYVQQNLQYPSQARKDGIQGKVFVEFIVNTDGSISDVKLVKGIGAGCDIEAARVMSESEPWNPGKKDGKIVRTKMVIPFSFKLDDVEATPQKEG